jgi:DNA-binding IclR family transcriptional regulator
MQLNDCEIAVLRVLADGRANPYLIREETGMNKGGVYTVVNRLGRNGYVEQVTHGLYRITIKGQEEVDDE